MPDLARHFFAVLLLTAPVQVARAAQLPLAHPADPTVARLDGSAGIAVAFDAAGQRILTAGGTSARVWDATTYKPLADPVQFDADVVAAVISADGRTAAAAAGGAAVVWRTDAARPSLVLRHPDAVLDVAFRPDGTAIATGCVDGIARVWDVASGKLIAEMKHEGAVRAVEFSSDGSKLLTTAVDVEWAARTGKGAKANTTRYADARVACWDAATGARDWAFDKLTRGRPAFSPDGRYVAVPSDGVCLLDARTGKLADGWVIGGSHSPQVRVLQFARGGDRILAAGDVLYYDGEDPSPVVVVIDVNKGKLGPPQGLARTRSFEFRAAAMDAGGRVVAIAGARWFAREDLAGLYSTADHLLQRFEPRAPYLPGGAAGERIVGFTPDGRRVAVGYVHEMDGNRVTYTMLWRVP